MSTGDTGGLEAAAQELGLEAHDPAELGEAARRAEIELGRLLGTLIEAGAVDTVPAVADAYARTILKAQAEIMGTVTHDLRGPLSGMLGLIQTLRRRTLPEQTVEEFLGRCEASCHKLELLIGDVGALAQLDAGTVSVLRERLDLVQVAEEVVRAAGGEIAVQMVTPLPSVQADHVRVVQILRRLVDNAVRYSASPPRLVVEGAGDCARFSVTDDGPGIPPEHVPHLFRRFFQVPGDKKRGRSGLGLAVASELAQVMGARITVESAPGEGSTFTLEVS